MNQVSHMTGMTVLQTADAVCINFLIQWRNITHKFTDLSILNKYDFERILESNVGGKIVRNVQYTSDRNYTRKLLLLQRLRQVLCDPQQSQHLASS